MSCASCLAVSDAFLLPALFSFFTASGIGLEAFFTMEGVLVVAVCTKKDYMAVSVPEKPLVDSAWVNMPQRVTAIKAAQEEHSPCIIFSVMQIVIATHPKT